MRVDLFELTLPEEPGTPVLVEVPHAGLFIPEAVRPYLRDLKKQIKRDCDIFVDELMVDAPARGATFLKANCSRYVVDLNRSDKAVDARTVPDHPEPQQHQPRGVVWRLAGNGQPLLAKPLDHRTFSERVARYHTPYHRTLSEQIDRLRTKHGFVIVLAAHSMPSREPRLGRRRADIVPGSRGRSSADPRVIDHVGTFFEQAGLSVAHDDPYQGGFTTQHYGRPKERVHVVQLEINRALYINEATYEKRSVGFAELRTTLSALVGSLGRLRL